MMKPTSEDTRRSATIAIRSALFSPDTHAACDCRLDGAACEAPSPAWATRAHLLAEAGRVEEAERAYERAVSLTTDTGMRGYLARQCARLRSEGSFARKSAPA